MIINRPKGSQLIGRLPTGCRYCEKGAKLVLLVTGLCSGRCFYCPLSERKRGKDVVYANEMAVRSDRDIIAEAESIHALGTGITGGDPFLVFERTLKYVRFLKRMFGLRHHIHLYTQSTDRAKIETLASAGLDELRFHPPPELWSKLDETKFSIAIRAAQDSGLRVGFEVPVLPDKKNELERLIHYAIETELDFINLNELEFAEMNWKELKKHGYRGRAGLSAGANGSEQLAYKLMRKFETDGITLHYCSSSFKDAVQLRNRLRRRARYTKPPWAIITDDSTFLKGVIECRNPRRLYRLLLQEFGVPEQKIHVDTEKKRIEVAPWLIEELAPLLAERTGTSAECFIVEEYPTADRLEVERYKVG